ncbi:MAG: hypothetical protein FH758_03280 [Firmicutes bacterium]|nr:hypothetical protein [Bacillota bacterium]
MSNEMTQQEYLSALIETYRGYKATPPQLELKDEQSLLKDVVSSAIRFAESEQVMQQLSEELFKCQKGECSFQQQVELTEKQMPEVLNAKMTAAAYLMKIISNEKRGINVEFTQ